MYELDFTQSYTSEELHQIGREAAAAGPAALAVPFGWKVFLRYEDVEALLHDPRVRAMGSLPIEAQGVVDGPLHRWWTQTLVQMDPPAHTRIRSLVGRAFTPRQVERMRPVARKAVEEALDELTPERGFDVWERFAHHVPVRVICAFLGVEDVDFDEMGRWSNDLGLAFGVIAGHRDRIEAALGSLYRCVDDLLEERRRQPRSDFLSALLAVEEQGDRLSHEELRAMAVNMLFAGHDTTKSLIAIATWLLAEHPDQLERLHENPGLAESAVEEVLRSEPPVVGSARIAGEPIERAGVVVEPGQLLDLYFLHANRDPEHFSEPDRFDVTRGDTSHLSFGRGSHFCLGASLARLEAQEAVRVLAEREVRLERVGEEPRWSLGQGIRRPLEPLMIRILSEH